MRGRVVQTVDAGAIRPRNQMPVRVDRYGNQPRSHLTRFAEAMLPLFDADTALADRRALERSGWNAHPPFVLPPWY